jgi:hypothetical protein
MRPLQVVPPIHRHSGGPCGRPRDRGNRAPERGGSGYRLDKKQGNSSVRARTEGAVFQERKTSVWVPPVCLGRPLRRVARPAEHGAVADVERRSASSERHDVIDGEIARGVRVALVARAPVAVLTAPGAEHSGAEALPWPRAVEGVVPAAVRLPGVLEAATARAAGDDTTDRTELHP